MSDDPRTRDDDAFRPVAVVLAVKDLHGAKSRLAGVLDARTRQALVLAMLTDTITAAWTAGADDVVVVTPDTTVAAAAQSVGARAFDEPAETYRTRNQANPLNAAFARGIDAARERDPRARVAVVQADLAALRPRSLVEAIAESSPASRAVVPDRSGDGTAALILADPDDRLTLFGLGSAQAHRNSGAVDLTRHGTGPEPSDRWADLRTDVDTVDDLVAAVALGVGPRTAHALDGVPLPYAVSCSGAGSRSGLDTSKRPDAS